MSYSLSKSFISHKSNQETRHLIGMAHKGAVTPDPLTFYPSLIHLKYIGSDHS